MTPLQKIIAFVALKLVVIAAIVIAVLKYNHLF